MNSPASPNAAAKRHIGQILISQGILTEDQLHQTKPALEYYRRALALAQSKPVTFDAAQVQKRVSQLAR